ncbi:MAG: hypothetical protein II266_02660 [Clostridia bacterium]|nr:hypothetical protein [Clostridia bacterium]
MRLLYAVPEDDLELVSAAGDVQPGLVEALMPQLVPPIADGAGKHKDSKN